ncbi:hypothetical protein [Pseudoduganella albidiflava]|uniref:Uncharacterized protein n=1 Tax=Pseudoduganella albidiflava TaxID=321983 RepID=A0A411X2J1_9BURK|nr:hypothetical protein [Pseudoduganella albidiflava]QBI03236.1 hypothetical protein EYF70_22205 [Pseudoduganella albidiflava]GGY69039.1 hypothetical protein GCM10007387_58880 [Pseudoduganella albidiflava]
MSSAIRGGSSVSARDRTPSLQLAKLADLVAKAVPKGEGGISAMPFMRLEGTTLHLNTRSVIQRLVANPSFQPEFVPGTETGFIRDVEIPPFGTTAKLGGRLVPGSEPATAHAVEKLRDAISSELDALMADVDFSALTIPSLSKALEVLAKSVGERVPEFPKTATMVPIQFAAPGRKSDERSKDVARVLSAIETIDGRNWLDVLLNGIATKLRKDGQEEMFIEEVVTAVRSQGTRPGSQIRQLLDFLDDEALSRVRLQVTLRLMECVAAQSNRPGMKAYVGRVRECFDMFAGIEADSLLLDVSSAYGLGNNSEFGDHLRKALFYHCLPAWAEWSVQLFETRTEPARGFNTVREVSYRFRVNGQNPQSGMSAFDTRLSRIHERVLAAPGPEQNVKRPVAELILLYLVIPKSIDDAEALDLGATAASIASQLKLDPVRTLTILHDRLTRRSKAMDDIADELVSVLQTKSRTLVDVVNRGVDKFTVALGREIVNWDAVESLTSSKTNVLKEAEKGPNSVVWFAHLTISDMPVVPGSIASYSVQTQLQERSFTPSGDAEQITIERDLSSAVLPVRLVPFRWTKEKLDWSSDIPNEAAFMAGAGVQVEYDLKTLKLSRVAEVDRARSEQLRAAVLTAFSLLTYVALWEVVRRTATALNRPVSMTMVRLQHSGKKSSREEDAHDGNTAIYSVSQALEKTLSRELPVKLQGLTTLDRNPADGYRWKKRGALHALLGSQPVKFDMPGELEKVALVTYVTRPCDLYPGHADADGFLFISRTYKASRENGQGVVRFDQMQSRVVDTRKDFNTPQSILEEISRLQKDGFEHIVLLSHHYGNRHIGRAAERHSPHGTLEFLDDAAKRFPGVFLYTLRRDVFPATRLRRRASHESAFEVVSFKDHQAMYDEIAPDVLRSLMPIYTFATLSVVGEESRPQSGFCTYFFDVEQRLSDMQLNETVRQNILGVGAGEGVRKSLVAVLRAIHFMESEKPSDKTHLLPVLDPFDWSSPTTTAAAGEVEIMSRRGGRSVLLSVPAVLAHVTKVLHKDRDLA